MKEEETSDMKSSNTKGNEKSLKEKDDFPPPINKINNEINQLKEFYNKLLIEIFNKFLKIFDPFNGPMKNKQFIIPISKMIDTSLVNNHIYRINQISTEKEIKDLLSKISTTLVDCFIQYFNIVEAHYCQNPHEISEMYSKLLTQNDEYLQEIQSLKNILSGKDAENSYMNKKDDKFNLNKMNPSKSNFIISNDVNELTICEKFRNKDTFSEGLLENLKDTQLKLLNLIKFKSFVYNELEVIKKTIEMNNACPFSSKEAIAKCGMELLTLIEDQKSKTKIANERHFQNLNQIIDGLQKFEQNEVAKYENERNEIERFNNKMQEIKKSLIEKYQQLNSNKIIMEQELKDQIFKLEADKISLINSKKICMHDIQMLTEQINSLKKENHELISKKRDYLSTSASRINMKSYPNYFEETPQDQTPIKTEQTPSKNNLKLIESEDKQNKDQFLFLKEENEKLNATINTLKEKLEKSEQIIEEYSKVDLLAKNGYKMIEEYKTLYENNLNDYRLLLCSYMKEIKKKNQKCENLLIQNNELFKEYCILENKTQQHDFELKEAKNKIILLLTKHEQLRYYIDDIFPLSTFSGYEEENLKSNYDEKLSIQLKKFIRCSICLKRWKTTIIDKCFHLFCKECTKSLIIKGNPICPSCSLPFNKENVKDLNWDIS